MFCSKLTVVCLAKVTDVHLAMVYILLRLIAVQFVNGLKPSINHVLVSWFNLSTTKCHARVMFVNGLRLCTNNLATEWDVEVPHFICQHRECYLTSLNIYRQICTCMASTGTI